MRPLDRPVLRTVEHSLAILVFLVVSIMVTNVPVTYPSWPTLGTFPVNPELVVPGLLGVAAMLGAATDGLRIDSVVIGAFGFVTFAMAVVSLHSLYAGTASGVFGGGILTLTVGIPLVALILCRGAARAVTVWRQ